VQTAAVVNKKSVQVIPNKPPEPEQPEEEEEEPASVSPRGVLGVDYTIGEDISDDSDFSDAGDEYDNKVGPLPARGQMGKFQPGHAVNLNNAIGKGRGKSSGVNGALAAYGKPISSKGKPPKASSRTPPDLRPPARGLGPKKGVAPRRVDPPPLGAERGVSAREMPGGRGGRPGMSSGSMSKDDLFTTLKKPLNKYYF